MTRGLTQYAPNKSNMADGRHFAKSVKSPYLCNLLTDVDEIWHYDAHWSLTADRPLKFRIFQNPRWRQPPSWKLQKSWYLRNGLTDLYEILYGAAKWGSWLLRPLKTWISKIQDGGRQPFWKLLNYNISANVRPFLDGIWQENSLSLIASDLPTNCRAYLQKLTDSKTLVFVIP